MRRAALRSAAGQATIEALVAVPLLLAVALVALQMAGVIGAALEADRVARVEAIDAAAAGRAVEVRRAVEAVDLLPGPGRLTIERRLVSDCLPDAC